MKDEKRTQRLIQWFLVWVRFLGLALEIVGTLPLRDNLVVVTVGMLVTLGSAISALGFWVSSAQ